MSFWLKSCLFNYHCWSKTCLKVLSFISGNIFRNEYHFWSKTWSKFEILSHCVFGVWHPHHSCFPSPIPHEALLTTLLVTQPGLGITLKSFSFATQSWWKIPTFFSFISAACHISVLLFYFLSSQSTLIMWFFFYPLLASLSTQTTEPQRTKLSPRWAWIWKAIIRQYDAFTLSAIAEKSSLCRTWQ